MTVGEDGPASAAASGGGRAGWVAEALREH